MPLKSANFFVLKRVSVNRHQGTAQIHEWWTIHLQQSDSGAACGSKSADHQPVITPGEMFRPAMLARMKEVCNRPCLRINRNGFRGFVSVAALTGEGEISGGSRAVQRARQDMLNREALGGIRFLALAILAASARPFSSCRNASGIGSAMPADSAAQFRQQLGGRDAAQLRQSDHAL